jgi:hypothetical protein
MNGFIYLPSEIFQMVLQYLPLYDLGAMDLAIMNSVLRPLYLSALPMMIIPQYVSDGSIQRNDEDGQIVSERLPDLCKSLEWMVLRKLRLLEISSDSFSASLFSLIMNSRNVLRTLLVKHLTSEAFIQLGTCSKLKTLGVDCTNDLEGFVIFLQHNPQIQTIVVNPAFECTPDLFSHISENCPSLTALNVSDNYFFSDECIAELTKGSLKLTYLDLSNTTILDESIPLILSTYPNLQFLSLFGCSISDEMIKLCLRQVSLPSLLQEDPEIQILGLRTALAASIFVRSLIFNLTLRCNFII